MNITQVNTIYFSPTGSTRRVMQQIAGGQKGNCQELDLTDARKNEPEYHFLENEAVFVGMPVYGGRIPAVAGNRLKKLYGNHTPAVIVVTYGNRNYDDALLELKELLEAQGFRIFAAAAVVTEHNIVRQIGTGRPDTQDQAAISAFAGQIAERLNALESTYQIGELKVKGNHPYREYSGLPLKPKAGKRCNQCGICIRKCPVQAISRTDAAILDAERCLTCMRCIAVCPTGARKLNPLLMKLASQGLKKKCKEHRLAEFFYEAK